MQESLSHSEWIFTRALEGTASRQNGTSMDGIINWPIMYKMKRNSINVGACSERGIFCELKWHWKSMAQWIWSLRELFLHDCKDDWGSTFSVLSSSLLKNALFSCNWGMRLLKYWILKHESYSISAQFSGQISFWNYSGQIGNVKRKKSEHWIFWCDTCNEMERSAYDQVSVYFIDFWYDVGLKHSQLKISPNSGVKAVIPSPPKIQSWNSTGFSVPAGRVRT